MSKTELRNVAVARFSETYNKALSDIQSVWGFSEAQILSPRRDKNLVDARAYAAQLLYNEEKHSSYVLVGRILNRDHASIMHLCKRDFFPKYEDVKDGTWR